jgi:hypothetical protein
MNIINSIVRWWGFVKIAIKGEKELEKYIKYIEARKKALIDVYSIQAVKTKTNENYKATK